jgi:hypothetical protein
VCRQRGGGEAVNEISSRCSLDLGSEGGHTLGHALAYLFKCVCIWVYHLEKILREILPADNEEDEVEQE